MTDLLEGKVALVTGGGGGIGRGISETFAASGAEVAVADVDEPRARATVAHIAERGGRAEAHVVDVTEPEQVAELASTLGAVDVLVNNVGHYLYRAVDFVETSQAEWDALYRVNLEHVFLCCRAFVPGMIERARGGSVINLSTVEAFRAASLLDIRLETGRTHQIRVHMAAVRHPCVGDLTYGADPTLGERLGLQRQWLGRFGRPDDIAGVALFLASELSAFVTGTTVHADGGSYAAGGWFRTERGGWTNRPLAP